MELYDLKIIKVLGTGSQSIVYLVRYNNSDNYYTMKKIPRKKKKMKMIDKEINSLKCNKHHYLINYVDVIKDKKYVYILTDYNDGYDLYTYITEYNRTIRRTWSKHNLKIIKLIVAQIISGLESLHNNSYVHLDLKLENILITNDGEVKIIDFGSMEKLDIDTKDKVILQMLDCICGTLEYISPEILRHYFNKSSDIWSLGIIIYELCSFQILYNGVDKKNIINKIKSYNIQHTYPDTFSTELKDLLNKIFTHYKSRITLEEIKKHSWFTDIDWQNIYIITK